MTFNPLTFDIWIDFILKFILFIVKNQGLRVNG